MAAIHHFYDRRYPVKDEVVMGKVINIAQMGAFVHLIEYENIEGWIPLSEISRQRIRSINKLIRIGDTLPLVTLAVDENRGYIDLSKRRVSVSERSICADRYSKAKMVDSILRVVARQTNDDFDAIYERLYEKVVWAVNRNQESDTAVYHMFETSLKNETILDLCQLSDTQKQILIEEIKKRMTPKAVQLKTEIELTCYKYDGIEAIKTALKAAHTHSNAQIPIKIRLVRSPLYALHTTTLNQTDALASLALAIEAVKQSIEEAGGYFKLITQPAVQTDKVVVEQEESYLQ